MSDKVHRRKDNFDKNEKLLVETTYGMIMQLTLLVSRSE